MLQDKYFAILEVNEKGELLIEAFCNDERKALESFYQDAPNKIVLLNLEKMKMFKLWSDAFYWIPLSPYCIIEGFRLYFLGYLKEKKDIKTAWSCYALDKIKQFER